MTALWLSAVLPVAALLMMHCRRQRRSALQAVGRSVGADHPRALARNAEQDPRRTRGSGAGARLRSEATTLLAELKTALDEQQFVLHYQPEVALESQAVVGLEALVRWRHPVRGLLGPEAFIPTAEQSQLIVPLGRWVLEESCQALSRLQRHHPGLRMAVNVSPSQMTHDRTWARDVLAVTAEAGVDPGDLIVEVTETLLMSDPRRCAAALQALRGAGVGVAIDDFGTGYSSLAYLADLPASIVKLDRRFVEELHNGRRHRDIVTCIAELATRLGMSLTAEGVEQRGQALLLQSLGWTTAQGFYFCPPIPEGATAEFLRLERSHALITAGARRAAYSAMNHLGSVAFAGLPLPLRTDPPFMGQVSC